MRSGGISIGIAYGLAYFLVNRPMGDAERAELASRRSIAGPNLEWLAVYTGLACLLAYFMDGQMGGWGWIDIGVVVAIGVLYVLRHRQWGRGDGENTAIALPGGDPTLERLGVMLGVLLGLGLSIRNGLKGWFNIYRGNEEYWGRRLWEYLGPAYVVLLVAIGLWVLFRPRRSPAMEARDPHAYGWMWLVLIVQNAIAMLVTGPLSVWSEMAFALYYLLLFFISGVIVFHYQSMSRRVV